MTKIDYAIGGFIGFFVGIFAIPALINLGIRDQVILLAFPWVAAPLFVFGIWLANYLLRWLPFMAQFGKFVVVGFLNTAIDFGILNSISAITGITAGLKVGGVNIPGFVVAVTNAYFWNKFWVFKSRDNKGALHDFPKFLLVSGTGLLLNSGMIVFITTYFAQPDSLSSPLWLNIAKVLATGLSLVWNFTGYKFIVFRKATPIAPL